MVDSALASALEMVNMDDVPVLTIATGHGEMLSNSNMASFVDMMENQNFEVAPSTCSPRRSPRTPRC